MRLEQSLKQSVRYYNMQMNVLWFWRWGRQGDFKPGWRNTLGRWWLMGVEYVFLDRWISRSVSVWSESDGGLIFTCLCFTSQLEKIRWYHVPIEVRRKVDLLLLWQNRACSLNKTVTKSQVHPSLTSQEFYICPLANVRVFDHFIQIFWWWRPWNGSPSHELVSSRIAQPSSVI